MKDRIARAAVAALLVFGACSSPPDPEPPTTAEREPGTERSESPSGGDGDERGDEAPRGKGARGGRDRGGGAGSDGGTATGDGGGDDTTEGTNEDDFSSAPYPDAGSYRYDQRGYEEFCNATDCDRRPLPAEQVVEVTYATRSARKAVVVSDARTSASRRVRSKTSYDRGSARVIEVYTEVRYEGFRFEETYDPAPPVEILRFPLEPGARWSGRWKASTSGDYEVRVTGRDRTSVSGRSVTAVRVETTTDFRGDFRGRARVVSWIDPATKALVHSRGVLNVMSDLGRYSTSFATRLTAGPPYR